MPFSPRPISSSRSIFSYLKRFLPFLHGVERTAPDRMAFHEGAIEVIRAHAGNDHRARAAFPVNSVHGVYPEEDTDVVE